MDEHGLLAVRAERVFVGIVHVDRALRQVSAIAMDADVHLLRLGAIGQGVQFPAVAEAERAITADAEVAHRVIREARHLHAAPAGCRHAVHVEAAALFGEVEERAAVLAPDRIAVLAGEGGELLVLLRGGIEGPDVARDRRRVVLAPIVLIALAVVVGDQAAIRAVARVLHGDGAELHHAAAFHGHGVELT